MPMKSRRARAQRAKASGVTVPAKDIDLADTSSLSRHAAKKSRHVMAQVVAADRKTSRKLPPGQGRRTVPRRAPGAEAAYKRSEAGNARAPGHRRKEDR